MSPVFTARSVPPGLGCGVPPAGAGAAALVTLVGWPAALLAGGGAVATGTLGAGAVHAATSSDPPPRPIKRRNIRRATMAHPSAFDCAELWTYPEPCQGTAGPQPRQICAQPNA